MSAVLWPWFILICLVGDGKDAEPQNATDTTIEEQITVTAERAPETLDQSAAGVSVVSREQIQSTPATDAADLVRYMPGVSVAYSAGRLGLNGFTIRGIGGNRVLTRVDGVATAEQFDFGPFKVHQVSMDVDILKSVEVVRGPGSSLYGSDAIGGVVSLQTVDPSDYLAGNINGRLKTAYEGKNDAVHASYSGALAFGNWETLVSVSRRWFGARENMGEIDTFDRSRTLPDNVDGEADQILAKAVWSNGNDQRIRFTLETFDSQADTELYSGQGTSVIFGLPTTISENVADDQQKRLRLSIDGQINGRFGHDQIGWRIFARDSESTQATSERRATVIGPVTREIVRTGNVNFEQQGSGLEVFAQKSWEGYGSHLLSWGFSHDVNDFEQFRDRTDFDVATGNPDAYTGSLIFPTRYFPNSEVAESGAYIQNRAELANGRVVLTTGLRWDRYELDPDENDRIFIDSTSGELPTGLTDDAVSPKVGLWWGLNDTVALTAQVARGFRAPPHSSVNSGFTNLVGGYQTLPNGDLEAETSDSLELGMRFKGARWALNVNWFDNTYDDFIVDAAFLGFGPTGILQFQAQNLDNAEITGLELEGFWQMDNQWRLRFAYADHEGENSDTGDPLDEIQPSEGVLGLTWRRPADDLAVTFSVLHSEGKSLDDVLVGEGDNPFLPDAYTTLDLSAFYQMDGGFRLNAGIFNLTDEEHYVWSEVRGRNADDAVLQRYSSPGRTFNVNLSFQW